MSWWPDIPEDDNQAFDGQLELNEYPPRIVTREEWGALESGEVEHMQEFPVPYLVCMHTNTRPCYNKEDCIRAVQDIQKEYMDKGEPDIPFNYLIDTEGNIYIGRGPTAVSMLYPEDDKRLSKANKNSINIGYIGSGGIEPPDVLIQGSASLTTILFDGKYIDETIKMLWHKIPSDIMPPEEYDPSKEEDRLLDHITGINKSMVYDKESLEKEM